MEFSYSDYIEYYKDGDYVDFEVYQLEIPKFNNLDEARKAFTRIRKAICRYEAEHINVYSAIGLSTHSSDGCLRVSSPKGGRPQKQFLGKKSRPHLHISSSSRALIRNIKKNEDQYSKRNSMKRKIVVKNNPFFPIDYIEKQSTYVYKTPGINAYVERHRLN